MNDELRQEEVGETIIEQKGSRTWLWVVLAVVVTALVVGGGVYGWMRVAAERGQGQGERVDSSDLLLPTADEQDGDNEVLDSEANDSDWVYDLRTYGELAPGEFDQRLVRVNVETGEAETVVESVKTAVPALQERFNEVLRFVSFPEHSDLIVMQAYLESSDAGGGDLYIFNKKTNDFSQLESNVVYAPRFQFEYDPVSPDGRFLLTIERTRLTDSLVLIDLVDDDFEKLMTLREGESFVGKELGGLGGALVDARWVGNTQVRYVAFDRQDYTTDELGSRNYQLLRDEVVDVFSGESSDADVSTNVSAAECTDPPETLEIGSTRYPIADEYSHLRFLGQIFTADDCGTGRFQEVTGGESQYRLGSTLILRVAGNADVGDVMRSIGYECAEQASDLDCREWRLDETVPVIDLLKLKPYSSRFSTDDCVNCG